MSELKTGIDIVENSRIQNGIEKFKQRFLNKIYTPREIQYCESKKNGFENYSGFFAAKEAVLKALGTGISQGLALKDIEVAHFDSGEPYAVLSDNAAKKLKSLGFSTVKISISHERLFSVAVAIIY